MRLFRAGVAGVAIAIQLSVGCSAAHAASAVKSAAEVIESWSGDSLKRGARADGAGTVNEEETFRVALEGTRGAVASGRDEVVSCFGAARAEAEAARAATERRHYDSAARHLQSAANWCNQGKQIRNKKVSEVQRVAGACMARAATTKNLSAIDATAHNSRIQQLAMSAQEAVGAHDEEAAARSALEKEYDRLRKKYPQERLQGAILYSHGGTHSFGMLAVPLKVLLDSSDGTPASTASTPPTSGTSGTSATRIEKPSRLLVQVGLSTTEADVSDAPGKKAMIGIVGVGYRLAPYATLSAGLARQEDRNEVYAGFTTPLATLTDLFGEQ